MPPPLQVSGLPQSPQSRRRPQPSPILPQYVPPTCAQVTGVHPSSGIPQTFGTWAPQTSPAGHAPQSSCPPQPLPITPQYRPVPEVQLMASAQLPSGWAIDTSAFEALLSGRLMTLLGPPSGRVAP